MIPSPAFLLLFHQNNSNRLIFNFNTLIPRSVYLYLSTREFPFRTWVNSPQIFHSFHFYFNQNITGHFLSQFLLFLFAHEQRNSQIISLLIIVAQINTGHRSTIYFSLFSVSHNARMKLCVFRNQIGEYPKWNYSNSWMLISLHLLDFSSQSLFCCTFNVRLALKYIFLKPRQCLL